MHRRIFAVLAGAAALLCAPAHAEFIFRMGNTVYVDGKAYDWEEWKKVRDDPKRLASQAPAQPAVTPVATAAPASPPAADFPRAASCITAGAYSEFPDEDERFECTRGLGALTREEILRQGWKVDLIEKIPAGAGSAPVFQYKLVISR